MNNTALVGGENAANASEGGRVFSLVLFDAKLVRLRIVSMEMVKRSGKLFCQ